MKVELVARSIPYNDEGMTSVCAEAAAICTASSNKGASLKGAMASQHWSVLEHVSFTFRISGVSRALLAQLTRHRIASFSVESQRYVDQSKSGFIIPPAMADDPKVLAFIKMSVKLYDELVDDGISKEDARYILPLAG